MNSRPRSQQPARNTTAPATGGYDRGGYDGDNSIEKLAWANLLDAAPSTAGGAVSPQLSSAASSCASALGFALAFGLALRLAFAEGLFGASSSDMNN